ncbi:phage chromosome segregation protein [Geomicrobium sp. JCM 19037]|uniref:DUF2493 domain-containing protein n=1 Tax=Geomicrobium sp. JCM 19037 TaxID=1460634 RepID=UPI00045F3518|nr:DUF2493 domain-containing protein [Geomicrobium sp. JCM 19037]GAK03277.1 phage chromosome segregation protein [Geomicrobium sp. JCM 19037]
MFRVIVAGSRDFSNYEFLRSRLDWALYERNEDIAIVSGGASGADALGERYADERGLIIVKYPADWSTHGKAAGPIRNREMAANADALAAFWDGKSRGTKNMIDEARNKGLRVIIFDTEAV